MPNPGQGKAIQRNHAACIRAELITGKGRFQLRPVAARDVGGLRKFLGGISESTIYFRFGRHDLGEVGQRRLRALCTVDFSRRVHYVAVFPGQQEEIIAGNARYEVDGSGLAAEFVILVADSWQGLRLGKSLLRVLEMHARASGIQVLYGNVLPGNARMVTMLQRMGYKPAIQAFDSEATCFVRHLMST